MKSTNLNTLIKLSLTSIFSLLILTLAACSDTVTPLSESISGADDLKVGHSSYGNADDYKCQSVSGTLDQTANPGEPLSGTISGDVEGTVVTIMTAPPTAQGAVLFLPGEQTWDVTGGIIESLIGQTLHLKVHVVGAQIPRIRINTTARVIDGAQRANLTYHGITDVSDPTMTTSHLEYHGVICP